VVIVIIMMAVDDDNLMMVVMITVLIVMMHDDDVAMVIAVAIMIIANVDGHAFLRNDHRLVARCRPGQRRRAQDRKCARDESQFLHLIFLFCPGVERGLLVGSASSNAKHRRIVPPAFAKNNF
jgi:hypothetical protein